jgi:hypothetical protein
VALARLAGRAGELPEAAARPSRRELRAGARAAQAERERERDAALEAAAQRRHAPGGPAAAPRDPAPEEGDDFDPDDPWAPAPRRER